MSVNFLFTSSDVIVDLGTTEKFYLVLPNVCKVVMRNWPKSSTWCFMFDDIKTVKTCLTTDNIGTKIILNQKLLRIGYFFTLFGYCITG